MGPRIKIAVFICGALLLAFILYSRSDYCKCKARINYDQIHINDDIDLDTLYKPADSIEINRIYRYWDNFSIKSDDYVIVNKSAYYQGRMLLIVRHQINEQKHYGAILFPEDFDETKSYPLLLWANGLDQSNPSVDIRNLGSIYMRMKSYFIVIPSFRGQSLVANGHRYCSDGFFGDAFDGATDDALRLLEVAKTECKGVDLERVVVGGVSRGGTVALLMGIRNPNINAVISIAGPTNFFSKEMYYRFPKQYKYQFLSKKLPLSSIREKMIKSSPIHFVERYQNHMLLIHGKNDKIVPVSHAYDVIDKLKNKKSFQYHIVNEGHTVHYETENILSWLKKYN
ncbi:prolyl oligopeptidase family serine peptidase [Aquimarina sp. D1M17]|uniref:alpha/beta hydrolase family protein n=1 Tax=Aquimarina acroporae TaxID=2937283 RepID=UPI0020BF926C|nr:prolyl oligopeptidase family serine peptidase [Aquimarina acroporae]MCK8522908.1 prolyl oligopeptidase family serine peptidase [Aquimarina acroporae]